MEVDDASLERKLGDLTSAYQAKATTEADRKKRIESINDIVHELAPMLKARRHLSCWTTA